MADPRRSPGPEQQTSNMAAIIVALLIAVVIAYACGKEEGSRTSTDDLAPMDLTSAAPEPVEMAPSPPVAAAAVLQAAADAERAIGAFSASGARLYSENCHAFLARRYSAATRDRCLAFDLIAAKLISEQGDLSEQDWFSEAAIRSRSLEASLLGGETDAAAQLHLTSLASLAQTLSVTPVAPPDPVPELAEVAVEAASLPGSSQASWLTALDDGTLLDETVPGGPLTSAAEAEDIEDERSSLLAD